MSASAAAASIPVSSEPEPPPLFIERDLRRRRLTVAFRLLLALPQFIFLYVLTAVGSLVLFVGWLAALVLGRLPDGIADFLGQIIRYTVRVLAYTLLLTDRYPPFQFSAEDYPVQVELAPGRLNRLAVLFRLLLQIPAEVLLAFTLVGWFVLSLFIWLLVLVLGRVPGALFDATTALLRYSFRYNAYYWLLSPAYPWGLFGDRPEPAAPPRAPVAGPAEAGGPLGPPAATAVADQTAELEQPRPSRRLVLPAAAKRLLVLFLVLGVASYAAGGVVSATLAGGTVSKARALNEVSAADTTLNSRGQKYQQDVAACGQELQCVQTATGELATAFEAFAGEVDGIKFPASAKDEATATVRASRDFAGTLRSLASASSPEEYTRRAGGLDQVSSAFDQRYQDLVNELSS
jgi:Domain of unknown function (DUF4389)